jgi:hypothetical protein
MAIEKLKLENVIGFITRSFRDTVIRKINELVDSCNNSGGYKSYVAILSQTGTNAPVATVIKNTIGEITWSYITVGGYAANSNYLFTTNKTVSFVTGRLDSGSFASDAVITYVGSALQVYVSCGAVGGPEANDLIKGEITIEIRVYN